MTATKPFEQEVDEFLTDQGIPFQKNVSVDDVKAGNTITLTGGGESVTVTDQQFLERTGKYLGDFSAEIPPDTDFAARNADFLPAPTVQDIAEKLIDECAEFEHLIETDIAYVWKQKGGESNGVATYGKCVKASGLVRFFGKQSFVIWIAADNCREWGFTRHQLEALVYHELCHAGEKQDKEGNPKAVVWGHDVELFGAEVRRYGLWHEGLRKVKPDFDQAELPGFLQS